MKNCILLSSVILAATFCSCVKTQEISSSIDIHRVTFSIEPFRSIEEDGSLPTKTGIDDDSGAFSWAQGDTVGIYPDAGSQVYFTVAAGESAGSAEFDGGGWEFKTTSSYYSYYPFIGDIYLDRANIPVSYQGQRQTGAADFSYIGKYDYMYTAATHAESGNLHFVYRHLSCLIRLRLTPPAGTYTKLAITAPSQAFILNGHYDLTAAQPAIAGDTYGNQLAVDLESVTTTTADQEFVVYLVSAPVNLQGVEITVSLLNSERKEYQCKKTPSYSYEAGNRYKLGCTSFMEVPQSMGLILEDWGDGGQIGGDAE